MTQRHTLAVEALGLVIRLTFVGEFPEDFTHRVDEAWKNALTSVADCDAELEFNADEVNFLGVDGLLEHLSVRVTLIALKQQAGKMLLFHAAGVATEEGSVMAFVGPSGRGKTTMSRTLGQHFGYVSDETVAVTPEGRVFTHRKPLSVKRQGQPKDQVAPEYFGLLPVPQTPLQLHTLVLLRRNSEVHEPYIEEVTLVEAITELVPEMSYLIKMKQPLQKLAALCASSRVVRLHYAEAATVVDVVAGGFTAVPENNEWQPVDVQSKGHSHDLQQNEHRGEERRLHPVGVIDAIQVGEETLLLTDQGMLLTLAGVGPSLWDAALRGLTIEETTSVVVAEFGFPEHEEPHTLVAAAIAELERAQVVRLV